MLPINHVYVVNFCSNGFFSIPLFWYVCFLLELTSIEEQLIDIIVRYGFDDWGIASPFLEIENVVKKEK